jgi:hypothetical protein
VRFAFLVEIEMERQQGKFESRETIGTELAELLEVDPGSIEGENGGTYDCTSWTVTEQEEPPRPRRPRRK